ncbi:GNAT family N-acetyltransferase [Actinomycetospora callitridis]|jgi:GNAT superfamily N-acetyltransferase|uniref:GNAT family N-acetyltransferase n=1 Tax=Actinomycetospora callitridis TaxID=913944 RepID=UPI0023668E5A|nr:GNAT family N-acetyltransferase [Actinomycetospora callitridis]MDD7919231.1 GNAT family N-acetyltransferase [Actinomycetospora callitridis]
MTWQWIAEQEPRWDQGKAAALGDLPPTLFGLGYPEVGQHLGDTWWRVEDDAGAALGYGRLDDTWGDAEILIVAAPGARGTGVGTFVLENLEREAASRQLNYVYNVVPTRHPDGETVREWLGAHGFTATEVGELRKKVASGAAPRGA